MQHQSIVESVNGALKQAHMSYQAAGPVAHLYLDIANSGAM